MVELYQPPNERTIAEIAAELRIGRETVREHLISAEVQRRPPKARGSRDPQLVAAAVRMYRDERRTLAEIAQAVGRKPTTVRSWLLSEKVTLRSPGVSANDTSVDETVSLYRSGMTIDEVAQAQGLHSSTVWERLVARNVKRRRPGRRTVRLTTPIRPAAVRITVPVDDEPPLGSEQPSAGLDALWAGMDASDSSELYTVAESLEAAAGSGRLRDS